ncbi:MAG: DUF5711 family protein [Thermoflexaceae bacterium]|nr:DUF5711 family protein [Thermoflexaceae bacterium]
MKKNKKNQMDNVIPYIKRKMSPAKIVMAILLIVVLIICLVNVYSSNMAYTSYDILKSVTREDGDTASYLKYGDGYIRYSNDGIAYYKNDGTAVWNHTYEINNAQVKICGEYIVVGNITGRNLYVYNKSGLKSEIDAAMTVTQVDVARQGVTAVSLEDGNTNYINMYDSNGTKLSYIITSLAGDGYPVDMAISNDGNKLAVSYVSVNGESLQSNVAFYNFSDVGQNSVDRLVGGFNHYGSSIVGRVEFVDNNTVLGIAEDRVSFYSITQYPELKAEVTFTDEIQKVTYNEEYVGLLFNNADSVDKYKMIIYNMKGQKVSELFFSEEYRNFEFSKDSILLYNEKVFTLMSIKGKIKYQDNFDMTIEKIIPLDNSQRFLVFNSKYIQEIKLN